MGLRGGTPPPPPHHPLRFLRACILPNMSRGKGNQTMKFDQLMDYNMRNIFLGKSYTQNWVEKLFPDPFLKNQCLVCLCISSLKFYTIYFYFIPRWWPGWQKTGFFVGAWKLNWKFPVKTFTCFCCLTTTCQSNPPTPKAYSYLPFRNSRFLFVRQCNKEY